MFLNKSTEDQVLPMHLPPPIMPHAPTPPPTLGLTLDNQLHSPVLRAGRVGDHTAILPCILLQRLVKVEAAIRSDGMPAASWELGRVRKPQFELRPYAEPAERERSGNRTAHRASGEQAGLRGLENPLAFAETPPPHKPSGLGGLDPTLPRPAGPGQAV